MIRFDAARHDDPGIMIQIFRDLMRGRWTPTPHPRWFEYRVNLREGPTGESAVLEQDLGAEFPIGLRTETGRRHTRLVLLTGDARGPAGPGDLRRVSCLHREEDRLDSFHYPDTHLVEEHLLVPAPGGRPDRGGWVIGTALDCKRRATELNLFDADRLADGPLASARLPYALPIGLHGTFVAAPA